MSTVLIVMAWLALFHFLYESVIAPSVRIQLRNRLFVTRDELRQVKIDGIETDDENVFWYVHEGVNSFLSRLPNLTVSGQVAAADAYKRDRALAAVVNERVAMVKRCRDDRIRKALDETVVVVQEAYAFNSGGWSIYVIPVAAFVVAYKHLKRLATSLVLTPETQTAKLLPQHC